MPGEVKDAGVGDMRLWKRAGTWLAVGMAVVAVSWTIREIEAHTRSMSHSPTLAVPAHADEGAEASLVLPAGATLDAPQPLRLDAAMARRAMREGTLHVTLPDGTAYPVRMEGQSTDAAGRWSVVGRVDTPLGGEAMVLTFGPDAVFGVLPTPSGRAMQIITGPGGRPRIAPAGGLTPDGTPVRGGVPDFRVPDVAMTDELLRVEEPALHHLRTTGAQVDRIAPTGQATTRAANALAPAKAPIDTTPVQIRVLALYSGDLVTLRGSVSAAQTEVSNLFAVANQAHIDSGSRVRLVMVGLQRFDLSAALTNGEVLDTLSSPYPPADFEAMRDTYEADLAAYIRPASQSDATCGASWLNGAGYAGTSGLEAKHGYVVADVAPCGIYALAHHLGHAMGAAHDRLAQTAPDGTVTHGAYAFSFGLRTKTFSTIMADPGDTEWLGRFSGPDPTGCNGAPCGIAERIDNVRTFNLMAPAIAEFRRTKNTAWVADAQWSEDRYGVIRVPIRLSMPAPPEGLAFSVSVGGGTAIKGTDYFDGSWTTLHVLGGERETFVMIQLRDDTAIEGDETIQVHIAGQVGVAISKADAVATILDDDPRPVVSGRMIVPAGVTLPQSVLFYYYNTNGSDGENWRSDYVQAPDYAYQIPMVAGVPIRLKLDPAIGTVFARRTALGEVWENRQLDMVLDKGIRVRGTLGVVPGMVQQAPYPPTVTVNEYIDGAMVGGPPAGYSEGVPYTYEFYAPPGATVEVYVEGSMSPTDGNTVPFAMWGGSLQDLREDTTFDVVQGSVENIIARVQGGAAKEGEDARIEVERLGAWPSTTLQFHYHTVDGTAKAGTHYVAASGTATIGPDQRSVIVPIHTLDDGDNSRSQSFDVVIDQVVGAEIHTPTLHVAIANEDSRTGGVSQVFKK
jgi:hypothetical protein